MCSSPPCISDGAPSFPSLWLHPLHTSVGSAPVALVPDAPEVGNSQALACFAAEAIRRHAEETNILLPWSTLTHSVTLGRHSLLVADMEKIDRSRRFDVPLLFAEMVSCQLVSPAGSDTTFNFIAVGRREAALAEPGIEDKLGIHGRFGTVWIMYVEGGLMALRCALACMGSMGAIRSDLHDAYEISPKSIGSGGCSTVFIARLKTSEVAQKSIAVAVKVLSQSPTQSDVSLLATSEASLLLTAQRHPNIVGFYGIFNYPEATGLRWAMNLEWCPGGDLHDELTTRGTYSEGQGAEILFGVVSALTHLHARGLVHRDVKAENILLSECGRPVLSDFGIVARLEDAVAMDQRCGSPGYAAPEILSGSQYCAKVDIFSTGVLLYFSLSGALPFSGGDISSILRRTVRCRVRFESSRFGTLSPHMRKTILVLMHKEPSDRLSSLEAMQHTWALYAVYLREHATWLSSIPPTPMETVLSSWSHSDPQRHVRTHSTGSRSNSKEVRCVSKSSDGARSEECSEAFSNSAGDRCENRSGIGNTSHSSELRAASRDNQDEVVDRVLSGSSAKQDPAQKVTTPSRILSKDGYSSFLEDSSVADASTDSAFLAISRRCPAPPTSPPRGGRKSTAYPSKNLLAPETRSPPCPPKTVHPPMSANGGRMPRYMFGNAQPQQEIKSRRLFRPMNFRRVLAQASKTQLARGDEDDPAANSADPCENHCIDGIDSDDIALRGWESWTSEVSCRRSSLSHGGSRRSWNSFLSNNSDGVDDDLGLTNPVTCQLGEPILEELEETHVPNLKESQIKPCIEKLNDTGGQHINVNGNSLQADTLDHDHLVLLDRHQQEVSPPTFQLCPTPPIKSESRVQRWKGRFTVSDKPSS